MNPGQTQAWHCMRSPKQDWMRFFLLGLKKLVKEAFLLGGFTEDSDCLPSAFKILSERFNIKKKFRANPQHTHQSLSEPLSLRQLWRSLSVYLPDVDGSVIMASSLVHFTPPSLEAEKKLIALLPPLLYATSNSFSSFIFVKTNVSCYFKCRTSDDVLSPPLALHSFSWQLNRSDFISEMWLMILPTSNRKHSFQWIP